MASCNAAATAIAAGSAVEIEEVGEDLVVETLAEEIAGTSIIIAVGEGEASTAGGETLAEEEVKAASTAEEAIEETSTTTTTLAVKAGRGTSKAAPTVDEVDSRAVEIAEEDSAVEAVISAEEGDSLVAVEAVSKPLGRRTTDTVLVAVGWVEVVWVEVVWVEEGWVEEEWAGEEWVEGRSETEAEWTEDTAIRSVRDIELSALSFLVVHRAVRRNGISKSHLCFRSRLDFSHRELATTTVRTRMSSPASNWNTESPNGAEEAESGISSVLAKDNLVKCVGSLVRLCCVAHADCGLDLAEISSKRNRDSLVRLSWSLRSWRRADRAGTQLCSTGSPSCKENRANSKNPTRSFKPVRCPTEPMLVRRLIAAPRRHRQSHSKQVGSLSRRQGLPPDFLSQRRQPLIRHSVTPTQLASHSLSNIVQTATRLPQINALSTHSSPFLPVSNTHQPTVTLLFPSTTALSTQPLRLQSPDHSHSHASGHLYVYLSRNARHRASPARTERVLSRDRLHPRFPFPRRRKRRLFVDRVLERWRSDRRRPACWRSGEAERRRGGERRGRRTASRCLQSISAGGALGSTRVVSAES